MEYNNIKERRLRVLELPGGKIPFSLWLAGIHNSTTQAIILAKLTKLRDPAFVNFKDVGGRVSELRIFYGAGYRIYFARSGGEIVVLIAGGDKKSQKRDIAIAKALWRKYENEVERYKRALSLSEIKRT